MKIGVLTSSRADFGIYLPLLNAIKADSFFDLRLIVFGTHLSYYHGYTADNIVESGYELNFKIDSMLIGDSAEANSTATALTSLKFASFWGGHRRDFDLVLALGDRYEMFAAVISGVPFGVKFAHIHAGETTLGAIDNIYRHAISLASILHFTSTKNYEKRVRAIMNGAKNVHTVGALGLDNILKMRMLSIEQFKDKWNIDLSIPTILVTFHPETILFDNNAGYAEQLCDSLTELVGNYQVLITMPNADTAGTIIRETFSRRLSSVERVVMVENLGTQSYFTAMKFCVFLLGNTSSGIIEAASFGKYVINVGNRQEGRDCSMNVIHSNITCDSILGKVLDVEKKDQFTGENIYYHGGAADKIISVLKAAII